MPAQDLIYFSDISYSFKMGFFCYQIFFFCHLQKSSNLFNNCGLYVVCMGYNGTSTLYANSSGPRISTIRPTAAWSTPAVSLTLDSSRSMRSFSRRTLPVDDVCSGTRTLHWWINKVRNLVDVLVFIHQNEEFWILDKDQKIRNGDINITYRWYLSRVVLAIMVIAFSLLFSQIIYFGCLKWYVSRIYHSILEGYNATPKYGSELSYCG